MADLRKQRLQDALALYTLFNEADGVEQWITEKVQFFCLLSCCRGFPNDSKSLSVVEESEKMTRILSLVMACTFVSNSESFQMMSEFSNIFKDFEFEKDSKFLLISMILVFAKGSKCYLGLQVFSIIVRVAKDAKYFHTF